jgi:hypothetical protein
MDTLYNWAKVTKLHMQLILWVLRHKTESLRKKGKDESGQCNYAMFYTALIFNFLEINLCPPFICVTSHKRIRVTVTSSGLRFCMCLPDQSPPGTQTLPLSPVLMFPAEPPCPDTSKLEVWWIQQVSKIPLQTLRLASFLSAEGRFRSPDIPRGSRFSVNLL